MSPHFAYPKRARAKAVECTIDELSQSGYNDTKQAKRGDIVFITVPKHVEKWLIPVWTLRKDAPPDVRAYCEEVNKTAMQLEHKPQFHFEGEED